MNRRRLIIIALGVAILGLVILVAYLFNRNRQSSQESDGSLPEIGGDFSQIAQTDVSDDLASSTVPLGPVIAFHASQDGSVIAVHRDGTIDQVNGTARITLSSNALNDIAYASFSADGSKLLVVRGREPRGQISIFDVANASWRVIPGAFRAVTWSPRGNQLGVLVADTKSNKTAVNILDTNGKLVSSLVSLALGDVGISWPAQNTVIVYDRPNAYSGGSAWAIDVTTKRVSFAARGNEGFDAVWDRTGRQGLAFEARIPGFGGSLSLLAGSAPVARLAFVTIPEKCTFADISTGASSSQQYAVCAVPRDQDAFQRYELPDAWLRHQIVTDDVIVGVNLDTKRIDFTVSPPLTIDASRLQVVGNTVYYTDRVSDKLYKSDI